MQKTIALMLKGFAMGIAEIIPGVSGGTIAFITGIYEELIDTIKSFGPHLISVLRKQGVSAFWTAINGSFLLKLIMGMLLGIVSGVFLITQLVQDYPEILWGFFFGLILASSVYIFRIMPSRSPKEYVLIILAAFIAFALTSIAPAEGSRSLPFVFLSGMVAISALMLPGISGSFILLIMGMYVIVIPELKLLITDFNTDSLLLIFIFGLGCLTGMAIFSRVLSYAFHHFKSPTFAILCGFMLGSLNKIWPWRIPTLWTDSSGTQWSSLETYTGEAEELKVLQEMKVFPDQYSSEPYLWATIISFILGLIIVAALTRGEAEKSKSATF
jgi:putative membrane protein